ncbi:ketosynthase chain-length factor [Pseudofrankia inefficax]|uniref:Beta-ketoacyl synthase n=1 Tax=Pseudofrankia inefficax (strain DSM 45817 / CECT 9037 / DDB 130130 / EuI1c) TaxID=298654 RepID=E3J3P8_PSEI1|nr:ketosynthase chain-length factor [Pseudofrankia inefficax]ADP79385.1 Beta-ketoacyl synthase [Pseudofrankia inefficax]
MSPTAVVTGLGVAAPTGLGVDAFWRATLDGTTGLGEVSGFDPSRYPVRLAGQVRDFEPAEHLPGRLLPQTDRVTRLAVAAAGWALADAAVRTEAVPASGMGVVLSNGQGGSEFTHREFQKLWTQGSRFVSVYESFAWFYAANTGQVSIRHGMRGPSGVLVGEQAGGLDAIGQARRNVRGGTPLVVTGGADSAFDPWGFIAQYSHGRVSRGRDPRRAYLPFDREADGHVPGEGAAILVVEDADAARDRAATVYGEIAGYAATFDPGPDSSRPPALRRAVERALADAGVAPGEVDAVFADAAGRPGPDRIEAQALADVFGPRGVPVTATKAAYGRLGAGGGPLDVVTALLAIRDGVIPATVNTADVPAEYALDLVTDDPRPAEVGVALVIARGYGGFNSAVVVRRPEVGPPAAP